VEEPDSKKPTHDEVGFFMVKIYQYCKDKPYNQLSVNRYWLNSLPAELGHLNDD
jgi:hypothetical protein